MIEYVKFAGNRHARSVDPADRRRNLSVIQKNNSPDVGSGSHPSGMELERLQDHDRREKSQSAQQAVPFWKQW